MMIANIETPAPGKPTPGVVGEDVAVGVGVWVKNNKVGKEVGLAGFLVEVGG